jgi:hypothetical protein
LTSCTATPFWSRSAKLDFSIRGIPPPAS